MAFFSKAALSQLKRMQNKKIGSARIRKSQATKQDQKIAFLKICDDMNSN